jgi:GTP pyrophosphokinase
VSTCPPVQAQPTAAREDALAGLCAILQATRPGADADLIRRSYDVAAFWHQDQRRKSGDPYITHPLAVATILAGTGADDDTLAQAMTVTECADARVLQIKIADRLHNMQTVQFVSQEKQLRKARESLDIFAPAASALRMGAIEAELETLARATMKRNRHARSASGRLLATVTTLLPAPAGARNGSGRSTTTPTGASAKR